MLPSVTPEGKAPEVTAKVGAGYPLAVNGNVPAEPRVKVVLLALVKAGASLTVNASACVALPMALVAVITILATPPEPVPGLPEITPVVEFNIKPVDSNPV